MARGGRRALGPAVRQQLLALEGVIGVGFGPKLAGGAVTAMESVVVFVERKRPNGELGPGALIPPEIADLPTDVRVPRFHRHPRPSAVAPHQECVGDYHWIDWAAVQARRRAAGRGAVDARDDEAPAPAAAATGPVPDPALTTALTTAVIGDLFVIHDPADRLLTRLGDTPTYDFISAYELFRRQLGDDYDIVAFYLDIASGVHDIGNASTVLFNDIAGIGLPPKDDRAAWASTRLRHRSHHSVLSERTLLHELGHLTCAYINYRDTPEGPTQHLLHQDFPDDAAHQAPLHWGRWVEDGASAMDYDRATWSRNEDGSFRRVTHRSDEFSPRFETYFGYSPLDLYLLGLASPAEVPSWSIVHDPTPAIADASLGPYRPQPQAVSLSIDNVVHEEGPRRPDHLASQRVFHQATIVITKDPSPTAPFIAACEMWRQKHCRNFRRATRGRAMLDASLLGANHQDLYIERSAGDRGMNAPLDGFWDAPDLWARDADDGAVSDEHQPIVPGKPGWLYARVRNRGPLPYAGVTVNFYLADPMDPIPRTHCLYPVDWLFPEGFLGSARIDRVPAAAAGIDGVALVRTPWTPPSRTPGSLSPPTLLCEVLPLEPEPSQLHGIAQNPRLALRNRIFVQAPAAPAGGAGRPAFLFVADFRAGHRLRSSRATRLTLTAERAAPEVRLFLDPGGLIPGIGDVGEPLTAALPPLAGGRFVLPGGVGAIADAGLAPAAATAASDPAAFIAAHDMRGFTPVVLNGKPLLAAGSGAPAALDLPLPAGGEARCAIIGIVAAGAGVGSFVCHLVESDGRGVVGGLDLEVKL